MLRVYSIFTRSARNVSYQDFLYAAAPILRQYGLPATVFVPTGLVGSRAHWDSYDKTKRLMDWDELQEVQRLGFSVASHTVSHLRLPECDEKALSYQLTHALETLRTRLAEAVILVLSYPFGHFGHREKQAARRAGYLAAVGTAGRLGNYPWTDPYQLEREEPNRWWRPIADARRRPWLRRRSIR